MIRQTIALALLLGGASFAEETEAGHNVVKLPRPNSGKFTTAEAEARKSEILSNKPTGKLVSWKKPYRGFNIHLHLDDSITVYGSPLDLIALERGKELTKQSAREVRKLARSINPFGGGNPAGILVTSDRPLKESKAFADVLPAVFIPGIQLFYVTNSEQDAADQTATAVDSKADDKEKAKPESEVRPR
ncbi:hypothetical protein [Haloferula sp.]|uniref:hypothetical protein n=1 Tax=Haloferula sp. TaxID=2497595 RepID=UPI00329BC053